MPIDPIGCPTPGACSCPPSLSDAAWWEATAREYARNARAAWTQVDALTARLSETKREAHVLATEWQARRDAMLAAHGRALQAAEARARNKPPDSGGGCL